MTISEKQFVSGQGYIIDSNGAIYRVDSLADYNSLETNKTYLLKIQDGYSVSEVVGEWGS